MPVVPRHRRLVPLVCGAALLVSCGGGGVDQPVAAAPTRSAAGSNPPAATTPTTDVVPTMTEGPVAATEANPIEPNPATTTAPEATASDVTVTEFAATDGLATGAEVGDGAVLDPLDDLDEDGTVDEVCGTADLGGGLVVETLCNEFLRPTPEGGVEPTATSLLWLPAPPRWEDLADVDATVRTARTVGGRRAVIYVLGSDTLFDAGSAAVRSTATPPLDAIVASITTRFPAAPISVRGAADSVGSADANQALSERRAAAVAAELSARGVDPARITSLGLGSAVPVAAEAAADGSVSEVGRQVNRRVEIVVG